MYEDFYHLSADPFRLTPDPRFCFRHRSYDLAWAYLRYAFQQAEGFVMVAGRSGTGKTTLIEAFQKELKPSGVVTARIASTSMEATDLLRAAAYSYAIDVEGLDKATLLQRIEQFLAKQMHCGKRVLLIIDEAQGLPRAALEELRLLTDLHTDMRPLLQVFLVGQEQLQDLMNAPEMEQFQQRVIGACRLEPLDLGETRAYMEHRLQRAGWQGDPQVTGPALLAIYRYSMGVPRHVNKICSRLLIYGSLDHKHELDEEDVLTVATELRGEQLAPLENDQTAYAKAEDSEWITELEEASLCIDDLAIRTVSPPAHATASPETAAGEAYDKVTTLLPGLPSARREPVEIHGPPVPQDLPAAPASPPEIRHRRRRLQQLAGLPGVISSGTVRRGTRLWQSAQQGLSAAWQRVRSERFSGQLNWQGELAVLVGALAVITLSTAGLAMYLGRDAGEHNALRMTKPGLAPLLPRVAGKAEHPVGAKPVAPGYTTVRTDVVATTPLLSPAEAATGSASQDTGTQLRIPGLAAPESDLASGTPDLAPADKHSAPVPARTDQNQESVIPLPAASLESPLTGSEAPADTAEETFTAQPQAAADNDNEAGVVTRVAVTSLEPLAVETQQQSLPPVDAVQEEITDLLTLGQKSRNEDRLLFPEEGSAYHYYQQVLVLEPGNRDALHGIDLIVKRYITLARTAMARQEIDKASRYVARGLRLHPDDRILVALQDKLRAASVNEKLEPQLPPPPPILVEEQPLAAEPEPSAETFFSRIRAFFTEGHATVESARIWEEDSDDW